MTDDSPLFSIGALARTTGVPVRTIRFWSDSGIVPPTQRSDGGYRLYDAEAVARIDLVRTLRALGLDLVSVQQILTEQVTVAEVARVHAAALDAEIRVLQLRRSVLRSVAHRNSSTEEMRLMHDLARLSAQERQQIINDFVDHAFDGIPADGPGSGIAQAMRTMPADLPEDPSPAQVDAWLELAELVRDESFQARVRQMAVAGAENAGTAAVIDSAPILEHGGAAVAAEIAPESAAGKDVLDRIVSPDTSAAERAELADQLDTFTDRRAERYWQLLGVINGWPPRPAGVPAFEWVIAALRAHR